MSRSLICVIEYEKGFNLRSTYLTGSFMVFTGSIVAIGSDSPLGLCAVNSCFTMPTVCGLVSAPTVDACGLLDTGADETTIVSSDLTGDKAFEKVEGISKTIFFCNVFVLVSVCILLKIFLICIGYIHVLVGLKLTSLYTLYLLHRSLHYQQQI